jgi:hypothetical protein
MSWTSSSGATGFHRTRSSPDAWATSCAQARTSPLWPSNRGFAEACRSRRAISRPSVQGMFKSMTTTSGGLLPTRRTASAAVCTISAVKPERRRACTTDSAAPRSASTTSTVRERRFVDARMDSSGPVPGFTRRGLAHPQPASERSAAGTAGAVPPAGAPSTSQRTGLAQVPQQLLRHRQLFGAGLHWSPARGDAACSTNPASAATEGMRNSRRPFSGKLISSSRASRAKARLTLSNVMPR